MPRNEFLNSNKDLSQTLDVKSSSDAKLSLSQTRFKNTFIYGAEVLAIFAMIKPADAASIPGLDTESVDIAPTDLSTSNRGAVDQKSPTKSSLGEAHAFNNEVDKGRASQTTGKSWADFALGIGTQPSDVVSNSDRSTTLISVPPTKEVQMDSTDSGKSVQARSNSLEVSRRSNERRDTSFSNEENLSKRELGANDVKPIMDLICKKLEQVDTWASQNPEMADKMLKCICDHPDQLEEWIDRNPKAALKMIEHGIDAISRHQEMHKRQMRRDAIDQGLQNQIEILRDRVSSADQASTLAKVALTMGVVLTVWVGGLNYNFHTFVKAIATSEQPQQQNFPLQPVDPTRNV